MVIIADCGCGEDAVEVNGLLFSFETSSASASAMALRPEPDSEELV